MLAIIICKLGRVALSYHCSASFDFAKMKDIDATISGFTISDPYERFTVIYKTSTTTSPWLITIANDAMLKSNKEKEKKREV